jgi:hypothetical protein
MKVKFDDWWDAAGLGEKDAVLQWLKQQGRDDEGFTYETAEEYFTVAYPDGAQDEQVSVEDIRIGYMNGQYDREGATEELSDIGADVSVINDWDDELDYYQQNA